MLRTDFQSLFHTQDIRDLPLRQMHAVMGARFWVICRKVGRDPVSDLAIRFRSVPAANAFIALAEAVGEAWPEPFTIMRPCCSAVSVDEAVLSDMIGAAARADRGGFHAILFDMIPHEARDTLFDAAVEFAGLFSPRRIAAS